MTRLVQSGPAGNQDPNVRGRPDKDTDVVGNETGEEAMRVKLSKQTMMQPKDEITAHEPTHQP